jgi:branched-chain amino acid transport system substrate-binding protein
MAMKRSVGVAAAAAALTLLAACSSSSAGTSSSGSGARTVKVGIMIDETGANAPAWTGYPTAIKIAFNDINKDGGVNGVKATYVIADSQSSTAGTLSAAQNLIEQDHVSVLMPMSEYFFAAEPYVLAQKIPVIGTGYDGPEWQVKSNTNLFNADGNFDRYGIYPGIGQFVKANGGTVCGAVGASDSPAATLQANQFIAECEAVGLKGTPVNSSLPFGSSDVGALALQLKSEHVNALFLPLLTTTAFPLLAQLKQLGADIKLPILRTGYAASTLASKATVTAAQGFVFDLTAAPVELQTPGAEDMNAALDAAGTPGPPSYGQTTIWAEAQALRAGLEKLGKNDATPANLITALRSVNDFNDGGLLSPLTINFAQYNTKTNCTWFVKLTGDAFVPYPGTPSCSTATKDLPSSS